MNHNEVQLLIGADPHPGPPAIAEHLANCPDCAQFQREMTALDGNIRLAMERAPLGAAPAATVTPIANAPAALRRKHTSVGAGWAVAASVAVISMVAVWTIRPTDTLAHEVVVHVEDEPKSWSMNQQPPTAKIKQTLAEAGVALDMSFNEISYVHSCPFRGHMVPHLVVSTPTGPITVIVLRYESVKHPMIFHEDGMTGVITPAPPGSIAVLMKGNQNIDAVARQVRQSMQWMP